LPLRLAFTCGDQRADGSHVNGSQGLGFVNLRLPSSSFTLNGVTHSPRGDGGIQIEFKSCQWWTAIDETETLTSIDIAPVRALVAASERKSKRQKTGVYVWFQKLVLRETLYWKSLEVQPPPLYPPPLYINTGSLL